jgi:hypothetical protein
MAEHEFKGFCLHLSYCSHDIICRNFDCYKMRSETTVRLSPDLEFGVEFADYFNRTDVGLDVFYHYITARVMPWRQPVVNEE